MNKSEIRKKILKIRKEKNFRNLIIDFQNIIRIIKKAKNSGKIIGGYYPYNYEIDVIKILEKLEKLNYLITLPKIKKNFQMNFFVGLSKIHYQLMNMGYQSQSQIKANIQIFC